MPSLAWFGVRPLVRNIRLKEATAIAAEDARKPPLAWAFLVVSALEVAGTVWAQLGATSATTLAGGEANGGLYTGVFLAVVGLCAGIATPFAPRLAGRFGTGRLFVCVTLLYALLRGAVGVALLSSGNPLLPLLCMAPVAGALGGLGLVLTPTLAHAYLGGTSLAHAYAVRSVASGFGASIGAVSAATVIGATQPGWGLIGSALLTAPIALLVLVRHPAGGFPAERASAKGGGGPLAHLSQSRELRRVSVLAAGVAIFVAPMISMVVPITQALRQSPLISGAGIMLAGVALGRLATPAIVSRLHRGRDDLSASLIAISCTGALMLAIALSNLLFSGRLELVVWAIIGTAVGATRFASRSLTVGAASASLGAGHGVAGVSTMALVAGISVPIGTLAWGLALSVVPPALVLCLGACGIVAVATLLRLTGRHQRAKES